MGEVAKPLSTTVRMDEFERLYRDDGARLERALVLFAGDRDIARDAVAEAFAQAMRAGDRLFDRRSWVWRAAFRIAAGELQDRRRRSSALPERGYEMPEPVVDLVRALAQLSPKQRACVVLFHYGDYSTKDVANIIGSTHGAVSVHLSVARRRLRELLEDGDDD
jgi:RNA polymerase sigma-70 factor (ECF subfamily)